MRIRLVAAIAAAVGGSLFMFAAPSGATVHEIIAQWCSGQDPLAPKGISDPTKPNFARPLIAAGVATPIPDGAGPGTLLIQFNFDHPAAKIVPAGTTPEPLFPGSTVFITPWATDDDFPAFANCPGYVGGREP